MHEIIDKKFYLGPKFGTLINKKWITISELLQRHRNHCHLPRSLLHSLTKLIARDKAVSTFELYSQTIKEKEFDMQYGCSKGRLYTSLFSLKKILYRVNIVCLEPCSTTSLYLY
jgi:hypothetical protein